MNYLHTTNMDFYALVMEFVFWLFCGAAGLAALAFVLAGLWEWLKIIQEGRNGN